MRETQATRFCQLAFQRIPLSLAAFLLLAGVAINLANVIGRYVFQWAIYWAEEAMIYLAIWSIFLAAVAVAYDRAELAMDAFSTMLSKRWKRVADVTMTLATVAVCLFMASQSLSILRTLIRNGQNSLALEIPMAIPQASLLFGFVLIAAAVVARFFWRSDNGDGTCVSHESEPSS